jgi:hypothetical protein
MHSQIGLAYYHKKQRRYSRRIRAAAVIPPGQAAGRQSADGDPEHAATLQKTGLSASSPSVNGC